VAFIRTLLDQLERDYRVDSKRIYAGGFSNGAMMSYRLGAELSERVAAIAVAAGAIGAKQADGSILMIPPPAHPLPVIAFHGEQDPVVPYAGGIGFEGVHFLSAADSIGFWVKQNGCKSTPSHKQWRLSAECEKEATIRAFIPAAICKLHDALPHRCTAVMPGPRTRPAPNLIVVGMAPVLYCSQPGKDIALQAV
jgi:polyhydroxybutyrate depolymerase